MQIRIHFSYTLQFSVFILSYFLHTLVSVTKQKVPRNVHKHLLWRTCKKNLWKIAASNKVFIFIRFVLIYFAWTFYTEIFDNEIDLELPSSKGIRAGWTGWAITHPIFVCPFLKRDIYLLYTARNYFAHPLWRSF